MLPVFAHGCAVATCQQAPAMFCFECEEWCCRDHLTQLTLLLTPQPVESLLCPSCLERHLTLPRTLRELQLAALGWWQLPSAEDAWHPPYGHTADE